MAQSAKFPIDLPPEYYAAIGEIAGRWSWLEYHLGVIIRVGFGLGKKESRVLTVGMAVKPKSHVLKIMAKKWIKDRALRKNIHALADDMQAKLNDRNAYVHALYCHLSGKPDKLGRYVMGSGEQRFLPEFKPAPISALQKCALELRELQEKTKQIVRELKTLKQEAP